jgi:acetyl esterase/lipase
MKFKLLLLVFFTLQICLAQTKYLDSISTVTKTTHTYHVFDEKDSLQLDFYKPESPNEVTPLLVYVHGGGFSGGHRDNDNSVQFANKIAKRGYAVASISYRLIMKKIGFDCDTQTEKKIEAIDTASEDLSLAVKYLIDNDSLFNINSRKIIISGTSAGGEIALNLAYVYNDNVLPEDFKFAGVISMAGAVTTLEHIDADKAVPTQLFHGTNDNLVPYHIAAHHYCSPEADGYLILYGSRAIADRLKGIGKSYYLFTINGGTHSWSGIPMHRSVTEVIDFLYYDVIKDSKRQTERTIGF